MSASCGTCSPSPISSVRTALRCWLGARPGRTRCGTRAQARPTWCPPRRGTPPDRRWAGSPIAPAGPRRGRGGTGPRSRPAGSGPSSPPPPPPAARRLDGGPEDVRPAERRDRAEGDIGGRRRKGRQPRRCRRRRTVRRARAAPARRPARTRWRRSGTRVGSSRGRRPPTFAVWSGHVGPDRAQQRPIELPLLVRSGRCRPAVGDAGTRRSAASGGAPYSPSSWTTMSGRHERVSSRRSATVGGTAIVEKRWNMARARCSTGSWGQLRRDLVRAQTRGRRAKPAGADPVDQVGAARRR